MSAGTSPTASGARRDPPSGGASRGVHSIVSTPGPASAGSFPTAGSPRLRRMSGNADRWCATRAGADPHVERIVDVAFSSTSKGLSNRWSTRSSLRWSIARSPIASRPAAFSIADGTYRGRRYVYAPEDVSMSRRNGGDCASTTGVRSCRPISRDCRANSVRDYALVQRGEAVLSERGEHLDGITSVTRAHDERVRCGAGLARFECARTTMGSTCPFVVRRRQVRDVEPASVREDGLLIPARSTPPRRRRAANSGRPGFARRVAVDNRGLTGSKGENIRS